MLSSVKKHWFLVGVVVVIALAKLAPWIGAKGGEFTAPTNRLSL